MKKIVLITGASRGIGKATALLFAQNGFDVAVNYKKNGKLAEEVVSEIKKLGRKAIAIKADIANEEDVIKMFSDCEAHLGKVSALVNNGGIAAATANVENITFQELDNMFKTNCYSAFLCSREAIKQMKSSGGAIINISSEAGKFGGNNMTHYAAAKAAVNTFTVGLAREVAKYNIRVNAVSPGVVDTDAQANISEERRSSLYASLPMGRMAKPEEVAETIYFLASDKSSYISGSIISVTGGR
jgi:NAD(P)-dependent dehydrogenase (short-subunit alcohol dehydrogenase family)